jgi:hypothetical protein
MREARRQNRHTRPALTKHTPIQRISRITLSGWPGGIARREHRAPVILSRQQLDQLWEIDRSEIIDTLYRLDNGQLRAYREYYDVRGWDPHDRQVYTPIHEACYDRGGIFRLF